MLPRLKELAEFLQEAAPGTSSPTYGGLRSPVRKGSGISGGGSVFTGGIRALLQTALVPGYSWEYS